MRGALDFAYLALMSVAREGVATLPDQLQYGGRHHAAGLVAFVERPAPGTQFFSLCVVVRELKKSFAERSRVPGNEPDGSSLTQERPSTWPIDGNDRPP